MIYHLQNLLEKTKRHVGEHESRGPSTNANALSYINDAVSLVGARILKLTPNFFTAYEDINLDGSLRYQLPLGTTRVSAVENITSGELNPDDTEPIYWENRFRHVSYLQSCSDKIRYAIRDGYIEIPGKASTGTLRVYYPQYLKSLFYMTCDSATSSTITCTTAPVSASGVGSIVSINDWYNGMFIVDTTGEFHEITDFDQATGVFTCGTWVTTPTVISLAVPMSPRFQQLIHLEAGINWRIDLDDDVRDMRNQTDYLWDELETFILKEQTHRGKHVKKRRF